MFISFSKTMAKFGGMRLGFGLRITKTNFIWMAFILMFVYLFQAMWYMLVLMGWLVYAVCYGIYWCIKKILGKQTKQSYTPSSNNNTQPSEASSKMKLKPWQIVLIIIGGLTIIGAIGNACGSDNNTNPTTPTLTTTQTIEETTHQVLASIGSDNKTIYAGDTVDITVLDATEDVVWSSNDKKIAEIVLLKNKNDSTARIKGIKEGTTVITAKVGSQELTCKIEVLKNPEETTQATTVAPTTTAPKAITVYITSTGSKYHRAGCRHLSDSKTEIELSKAQSQGYEPCGTCY